MEAAELQQLFHEQNKRKVDEEFQGIGSDFGRPSADNILSEKLDGGSSMFSQMMLHNTQSAQFLPSHSFSTAAKLNIHSLANSMSFPLDHHSDPVGTSRESKLQSKSDGPNWHAMGSGSQYGYMNSEIDPATVFSPIQLHTLRLLFRVSMDEFLCAKTPTMGVNPYSTIGLNRQSFSSNRPPSESRSDEDDDDGTIMLTASEKKLVRHTIEERWPDGNFPCPKDVKYTELNELAHAAAMKIMGTKAIDNPTLLKSKIKKQINRALTNKRRHLAIKNNPDMREKVVNKMKRFRAKIKDVEKRPDKDDSRHHHTTLLSLGGLPWGQSGSSLVGSSGHPGLSGASSHLGSHLSSQYR